MGVRGVVRGGGGGGSGGDRISNLKSHRLPNPAKQSAEVARCCRVCVRVRVCVFRQPDEETSKLYRRKIGTWVLTAARAVFVCTVAVLETGRAGHFLRGRRPEMKECSTVWRKRPRGPRQVSHTHKRIHTDTDEIKSRR